MSARGRRVKPFSPGRERSATLDARTVGRDEILGLLDQRLRSLTGSRNRAHTLLIGPRGAGKTHVVEVALHRAHEIDSFGDRVAVVRLDEDLVGVPRLIDLQREILRRLTPAAATSGDLAAAIGSALAGRALVLVIENVDRLFATLGEAGQQNFRGWIETSGEVFVLATAPVLFPGVRDRALPWYGNFGIAHLDELDLDDGRELLIRRAEEDGDDALVAFLRSDRGLARLKAVNALAGGSPRIWMILSDVITVDLLDELVPAVEALLEGLVPYYQQLLWDLSPVEQLAVRALADGATQAMTVRELAAATDTDQRSLSTTLGRLVDSRWLRAEKPDGVDKRLTYYRLREPMLRHHLRYRAADDQSLPLVVEMLRAWFDRDRLRDLLADDSRAPSQRGRLLARAFDVTPHPFDDAYRAHDVDHLLASARSWIHDGDRNIRTRPAGRLVEAAVLLVRGAELPDSPAAGSDGSSIAAGITAMAASLPRLAGSSPEQRLGVLLDEAGRFGDDRTRAVLAVVGAGWSERDRGVAESFARIDAVVGRPDLAWDDDLRLEAEGLHAQWSADAVGPAQAVRSLRRLADRFLSRGQPYLSGSAHAEYAATVWGIQVGEAARAYHRVRRLRRALSASAGTDLSAAAVAVAASAGGLALVGFADNVARGCAEPVDDDTPTAGLFADLRASVLGDARALARLPDELVQIVEHVRTEVSAG